METNLAASRIAINGNYMLRRPQHSNNEVVAPKEEEKSSADNPVCDTSACTVLATGIKNLELLVKKKTRNKEVASE
jgi:hypothetical protein